MYGTEGVYVGHSIADKYFGKQSSESIGYGVFFPVGDAEAGQSAEACASSDGHDAYPSIPSARTTKIFSKTNGRSGVAESGT